MSSTTRMEKSTQYIVLAGLNRLCTRLANIRSAVALQYGRRWRQFHRLLKVEGLRGIVDRFRATAAERIAPKNVALPFFRSDVLGADLSRPPVIRTLQLIPGQRPIVNWVTIPAGARSGGNTTLFRIIRHLENNGYTNRVYFYNVFGADHSYYESIVRNFYDFHGEVARLEDGMEDAHAVVATSWPTAYPVFNFQGTGKRFYFVQDFEPYFYPAGALSLLAENTYRMGFHAITVGRCFAEKLSTEFGMTVDSFEYGCDTSRYSRIENSRRSGVVFYAHRENARRGFELGLMALEVFAARRPDVEIHIFGDKVGKLPFAFVDHGRVTPDELNGIYNRCYAGLSLSFTNVSLVPNEMLAAGCIPVVNDSAAVRVDVKSPFVTYSTPSPHSLASALEQLIMRPDFDSFSRAGAASVRHTTWDHAGAAVAAILQRAWK
jgi:glycosyltransferase involved in cell wall biosynthesis